MGRRVLEQDRVLYQAHKQEGDEHFPAWIFIDKATLVLYSDLAGEHEVNGEVRPLSTAQLKVELVDGARSGIYSVPSENKPVRVILGRRSKIRSQEDKPHAKNQSKRKQLS